MTPQQFASQMKLRPGATFAQLRRLEQQFDFKLPSDYEQFLLWSNGAVGSIGESSYLDIWSDEEILRANLALEVQLYAPDLIAIAGNGGGTGFAFDVGESHLPIRQFEYITIDPLEAPIYATSFTHLLERMSRDEL